MASHRVANWGGLQVQEQIQFLSDQVMVNAALRMFSPPKAEAGPRAQVKWQNKVVFKALGIKSVKAVPGGIFKWFEANEARRAPSQTASARWSKYGPFAVRVSALYKAECEL